MSPSDPVRVSAGLASRGRGVCVCGLRLQKKKKSSARQKKEHFAFNCSPFGASFPPSATSDGEQQTNRYPEVLSLLFHPPRCQLNLQQNPPGCRMGVIDYIPPAHRAIISSLDGNNEGGLGAPRGAPCTTPYMPLYTCSRCREHTAEFNLHRF